MPRALERQEPSIGVRSADSRAGRVILSAANLTRSNGDAFFPMRRKPEGTGACRPEILGLILSQRRFVGMVPSSQTRLSGDRLS